jgi:hypothetical protein
MVRLLGIASAGRVVATAKGSDRHSVGCNMVTELEPQGKGKDSRARQLSYVCRRAPYYSMLLGKHGLPAPEHQLAHGYPVPRIWPLDCSKIIIADGMLCAELCAGARFGQPSRMSTMKVDDQAKIDLFQEVIPIVMQYLAANSPDNALIADDIIDFFALSIASVIENDADLATRQQERQGVEAAGKHIAHWVRHLKLEHETRGNSLLAMTIGAVKPVGPVDS